MMNFDPICTILKDMVVSGEMGTFQIKRGCYFHIDLFQDARIYRQDPKDQQEACLEYGAYQQICGNYHELIEFCKQIQGVLYDTEGLKKNGVDEADIS